MEESVLIDWASKISKKYVSKELSQEIHNNANQFITWLREAEEEEESGDDSDEVEVKYIFLTLHDCAKFVYSYFFDFICFIGVLIELIFFQIEYNDRVHTSTLKAKTPPPVAAKSSADDNEDDVDIDAI